jgi:LPS-assembly lipoprotein
MWLAEIVHKARMTALLAAVVAGFVLSGCQVRPLYGSGASTDIAGGSPSVRQSLRQIDIADPRDRPEQVFRNALLFNLQGGNGEAQTRYRLTYRLVLREQQIALEEITGTPASYQILGHISYLLEDNDTGDVLMTDKVTAIASYDRSSQNFANVRAKRDGEDRVGKELARLVEIRISSYFAAR